MGHLPVIADAFRVTLEWRAGGVTDMANVMHFYSPDATEPEVSTSVQSNLTPEMFEPCSSALHLVGIDVLALDGTSSTFHQTLDGSFDGQGGTNYIPAEAAIVSLLTGFRGPQHRGRVFLPAVAENRQEGGVIDEGARSTCELAWEDFNAAMNTDGAPLVVASYKHSLVTPVTTIDVKQRSGTVRRRNH